MSILVGAGVVVDVVLFLYFKLLEINDLVRIKEKTRNTKRKHLILQKEAPGLQ